MKAEESILVLDKATLPREANKTADSVFDRIYKYYHSKSRVELSVDEQGIMERWEKAWLLLCRHRTRNQVSQLLVKLFNVSRATAYDDVRHAMNLFSDPREDMKAAKRAIAEDNFLKGADKAWKSGDLEMHLKYMDKYSEVNGLMDESPDGGLAELIKQFKPTQIVMNFKAEDLMTEAERMRQVFSESTDFEELKE
jgi:hypothetical protein